jgi:hypothetical protein
VKAGSLHRLRCQLLRHAKSGSAELRMSRAGACFSFKDQVEDPFAAPHQSQMTAANNAVSCNGISLRLQASARLVTLDRRDLQDNKIKPKQDQAERKRCRH